MPVHVPRCFEQLLHKKSGLGLSEAFASLEQLIETLIVAEFQQNVAVGSVFKVVFVLTHIAVLEIAMNFDFGLQLVRSEKSKEEREKSLRKGCKTKPWSNKEKQRTSNYKNASSSYLLSSACFDQIGLGDDFDGIILASVHGCTKIDLGKSTLS